MGRTSAFTALLVLAMITITGGENYDILQGLQQLFQPYKNNNYFNQYIGVNRTPTHKQSHRQENKKKTSEHRHHNEGGRTKKPPVNQYDFVFATTEKASKKTTNSNSSHSNSRNKNQTSNRLIDYSNSYDITTKTNKVNRIKTTTTTEVNYYSKYYDSDNRGTTENVFSNHFNVNRPVTENVFGNVNYAVNESPVLENVNNRRPAIIGYPQYNNNDNRDKNRNNDNFGVLNTDYNANFPSLPTNNRNPDVYGINLNNRGSVSTWGTPNNRNQNNFGSPNNQFLNTDYNPDIPNNFGSSIGVNNFNTAKPNNIIPSVFNSGSNNNFGNTGVNLNNRGNININNRGNTNNEGKPNNWSNINNFQTNQSNFVPGPVTFLYPSDSLDLPGVRPAPVDTNLPPITNRPVVNDNFFKQIPSDLGSVTNSNRRTEPEILIGPDEDDMSERQKRRYIELAERMCNNYKSLLVKKVVALPLVPSPDPVELNVSDCTPINVPLVIGGTIVGIKDFPHMALVGWVKTTSPGYSWKCGGSLISDQYILTAGHCTYQDRDGGAVSGPPQVIQLGSTYLDDPGALVVRVSAVVRHPRYKLKWAYHDVALIKMVSKVTFSEVIRPACLGVPPPEGSNVIATGWGRTEFGGDHSLELRSVSLPVWDMEECKEIWGVSRKLPNGVTPDSHMCAGVKRGGKDTCQGDSGGPAQIQDGCLWRVTGVTSYGRSCGAPDTPALYAIIPRAFIAAQVFANQRS